MKIESGAAMAPNPFNPGSPIDPSDFAGRVKELENFRQRLLQTISGSLASMAVAGGYGIGKTSFLHKCKAIAEEQKALTIYFSLNEMDELSKESLARVLIQRIKDKVLEEVLLKRISKSIYDAVEKIRIKAGSIELSVSNSGVQEMPNLQAALSAAWKAVEKTKTAVVFLIDEARVLEKNRAELILYLRVVLEQLQVEHIPVMIVPAGKLSISGPSGTGFSPLVRTFPPVILENFSMEECRAFVSKKLSQVGITINTAVFERVYEITEGHPYVLSAYLYLAYSKLQVGEKELEERHFKAADVEFVRPMLVPFLSRFYDQAGKNSKQILLEMAKRKGETSLSELSGRLRKGMNELSPNLAKLVQDGAIIRADRGKYRLFHHVLGEYIQKTTQITALHGIDSELY